MKIRLLLALLGSAIGFAVPIFGQEKEEAKPFPFTPLCAGPPLVQQIEAINQKFDDGSRKFGGYLAIVYTFVGGTWKIRTSVFKYPTS